MYFAEQERERQISGLEAEQEEANQAAEDAYQTSLEMAGKAPSKSSIRKGKKTNREAEKELLEHGLPIITPNISPTETLATDDDLGHDDLAPEVPPLYPPSGEFTESSEPEVIALNPVISTMPKKKSVFARIAQTRQTEICHA